MIRLLVIVSLWLGGMTAVSAKCNGSNLFDAMPVGQQERIKARANVVPYAQGILWQAKRGDEFLTILGTNHVPDARQANVVTALKPYLDRAKTLLVEAAPKEEKALAAAMQSDPSLMFMADGSIPDMLNEEEWQALRKLGEDRGLPSALLAKMQPAFVAANLSIPVCAVTQMQAGASGVDKKVIKLAQARDLAIRSLEPYDTIFKIFGQIPQEDEIDMLKGAIAYAEVSEDGTATMADLYARGDIQLIWEFNRQQSLDLGEDPEKVDHQMELGREVMINKRNHDWIATIDAAAREGPVVVAAGALHLPGKDGVLNLLREDGWQISALKIPGLDPSHTYAQAR
ncbi:hypothetical protein BFP70_12375 [Thioclava sp. SK-1]|uniref:TraB/GumN family protein n=1 Tax=Thioclava sp. SK-1 TaxID=1889770 RepID=UPI000826A279|nr:TraB/GumN family protein [Thioclava sp. SK-1]OCX63439.1 hypothetical protein BFP70_12375 [Thioclava sp. SK-1]